MKKTITSAAGAAVAALAVAFSPLLLAQNTSGPDQSQNSRGTDSTADQHAGSTGAPGASTVDKNDSKNGSSQTIDPNVNQTKTGSDMTSATKTPSDATTSPVEQTQANEARTRTAASGDKAEKPLSDKEFVMRAAQGGMTEVELGKEASEKGGTSEVKDFGNRMVKDHTAANDELKSLAEKKGIALTDKLDARHQGQVDKLSRLSGSAFDKAYVTNQVRAHESTVQLFQEEAQSGQDADLKAFASRTLPTLQDHCSSIKGIENNGAK